jgi:hypothetical protein
MFTSPGLARCAKRDGPAFLTAGSMTHKTEFTPDACLAARQLLNWAQMTLARSAGVGVRAVIDFERQRAAALNVAALIKDALERAGLEFVAGEPRFKVQNDDFFASDDQPPVRSDAWDFTRFSSIRQTESK